MYANGPEPCDVRMMMPGAITFAPVFGTASGGHDAMTVSRPGAAPMWCIGKERSGRGTGHALFAAVQRADREPSREEPIIFGRDM